MDAAGVPTARTLADRAARAVRGEGGRARRRQGRAGLPRPRMSSTRRSAPPQAFGRPRSSSRSCSRATSSRVFALVRRRQVLPLAVGARLQADRRRRHRPEHRRHGRLLAGAAASPDRRRSSSTPIHRPVLGELARRGAPFAGLLYAGLMLTRRRAARARVQLPLRRPRDAGRCCPGSTATCSPRSPRPRTASSAARASRVADDAAVTVVARRRATTRRAATRGTPIDGVERPGDRRARLPRGNGACATAGSSRTAAASSPSPASARRVEAARDEAYDAAGRIALRRRAASAATSPRRCTPLPEPLVGILVGSESDRARDGGGDEELDERGIAVGVQRAVRAPQPGREVAEYATTALDRGIRVLIAGAGLAAALPGVVAAHTDLPVIGVPLRSSSLCSTGSTRCSPSPRCRPASRSPAWASTIRRTRPCSPRESSVY